MPSIQINSRGTTIKLTRAEVRAMQTAYAALDAVNHYHQTTTVAADAGGGCAAIKSVLKAFGEAAEPEAK